MTPAQVETGSNPRKKTKLVCGVGRNDSATVVRRSAGGKQVWRCPFYRVWHNMLHRSYSAKYRVAFPTYTDCSVVPEWHVFSVFKAWMQAQAWEGNELDKDILRAGNKVYGPDTCVFVPKRVNSFVLDCTNKRGEWPIGVSWDKTKGVLLAHCHNPSTGKSDHLGLFSCEHKAHLAWAAKKLEHACVVASEQADHRVAAALVARYERSYREAVARCAQKEPDSEVYQ